MHRKRASRNQVTDSRASRIGPLILAGLLLSAGGCARPSMHAQLDPMHFTNDRPPIDGAITVCLTPKLRRRTWNVRDHPFTVQLGQRASVNFESMTKAAFREVTTNLDAGCGKPSARPRITARIDSANRVLNFDAGRDQVTVVTMTFSIYGADNKRLWRETTVGEVITDPVFLIQRHKDAAHAMGQAIRKAINLAYPALLDSKVLRQAFEPATFREVEGGN